MDAIKLEVLAGLHSLLLRRDDYADMMKRALHCIENRQDEWWWVRRNDTLEEWVKTFGFVNVDAELRLCA